MFLIYDRMHNFSRMYHVVKFISDRDYTLYLSTVGLLKCEEEAPDGNRRERLDRGSKQSESIPRHHLGHFGLQFNHQTLQSRKSRGFSGVRAL
jgi:hypothetical protein